MLYVDLIAYPKGLQSQTVNSDKHIVKVYTITLFETY